MSISPNDLRIYIIFRADLPEMTRAKGEVQAAHAAASLIYQEMRAGNPLIHDYMGEVKALLWEGQTKIAVEVENQSQLERLIVRAEDMGIPSLLVRDAAHTVFSTPTYTCAAFGPCSRKEGNNLTRETKRRT